MSHIQTVLLIEDDEVDAEQIRRLLTSQADTNSQNDKFQIVDATRLAVGLERLSEKAIDVVLLDLGLPDSGGLEGLSRILKHSPHVPIVVLTGVDDRTVADQAVREGAQDFLVKGQFDDESLLRSMRYAIERQRLLRELEEQRQAQKAKVEAEAANRAKTQFLTTMSHELRTPLNHIIGLSSMLKEDAEDRNDKEMVDDLEKIEAAGERLNALITAVLDLADLESGVTELSISDVDIHQIVQDSSNSFADKAREKGNALELICPADLGVMRSDPELIQRCLHCLLSNACKFTEHGVIKVAVARQKGTVIFTITDTGIGMTDEQIDQIFLPFTQADQSSTRRFDGVGIGLTVTQKYCELLQGTIEVESEEGVGSTFTIILSGHLK